MAGWLEELATNLHEDFREGLADVKLEHRHIRTMFILMFSM